MNEREDLPNWTGGPQDGPGVVMTPPRRPSGSGRTVVVALFGLTILIGMGAIGYLFAQSQADNETSTDGELAGPSVDAEAGEADGLESTEADSSTEGSDGNGSADDDALTVDIEDETTEGTGDSEDDTADNGASAEDNQSTRTAVFRGGKLYLGGAVPSQEVADLIAAKAAAVVGPDNLVVEYEIDPSVVIDPGESTPLYVEDVVLFGFNSVSIEPPFFPLLDLGTLLLSQNPQATLTVVTRTDAVGSEEINLEVARKRAQAVIDYWISKGVNPDQLVADPRGEELASEDDDEQTAALQRRAEFIITGLLD
ncbi:MAG: OmpA family protein [Acidimicrobiia bacterium]|nr:OmpA family protein [Acidimicrobiia bacterium]